MDYITQEPCPRKVDKPRCNTECVRNGRGRTDVFSAAGADDAVVVVDCQGRICEWDSKAEGLFGYQAVQVVGRNFFQLIAPHCLSQETDGVPCHRRLIRTAGRAVNLIAKHLSGEDIQIAMHTFAGCTKEEGGALLVVHQVAAGERDARRNW